MRKEKRIGFSALRGGWLFILFFTLACGTMAGDFHQRSLLVKMATRLETSDTPRDSLPVSPEACRRWTVLPASALDARWWVIHAETALSKGRIRYTDLDNAPFGREVHWSSAPIWLLNGIAQFAAAFTSTNPKDQVQNAPIWYGTVVFSLLAIIILSIVGPRWGWPYAGFMIFMLASSFPVYENFRTGDAGHRGLVLVFLLGSALCLVSGGMGWTLSANSRAGARYPLVYSSFKTARIYFALAGFLGAAGLWISAATTIPLLIVCALGAVAAALCHTDDRSLVLRPELWRIWSLFGCLGSLGFYLLEYFPAHFGWRLEVNHPIYAISWLAGGDILSRLLAKVSGGRFVSGAIRDCLILSCAVIGLLLAPALIIFSSKYFFWVADPFLFRLHKEHIREFESCWTFFRTRGGWSGAFENLTWPLFAMSLLGSLCIWAKPMKTWYPVLAFSYGAAAAIQILAWLQIRWSGMAICLWAICILVVFVIYFRRQFTASVPWGVRVFLSCWAIASLLYFPLSVAQCALAPENSSTQLPRSLVPTILLRDVAHRLAEANPQRLPVVLSDPTSSTELTYYAGIRTVGTLYWENMQGLKRAADIFSSPTEKELREKLHQAGATHIIFPSWDDFSDLSTYTRLLNRKDIPYFQQILDGTATPSWIREYPYPVPPAFGVPDEKIRVFEILEHLPK